MDTAVKNRVLRALGRIPHLLLALLVFMPFYICFVYAFGAPDSLLGNGNVLLPNSLTLTNLEAVLTKNVYFFTGLKNSVITTVPTVLLLGIVTPMCAYILARFSRLRICRIIRSLMVASLLLPFQAIMLPLYIGLKNTGLINTHFGFIITKGSFTIAFDVTIIIGFIKSIPQALEEAARIDGASRYRTFWKIIFPLMQPVTITVLVLNVLTVWNDFSSSLIILQRTAVRTLPLAQYFYFSEGYIDLNLAFAFALLSMTPLLILYLFTQKYIVAGIVSGAIKG